MKSESEQKKGRCAGSHRGCRGYVSVRLLANFESSQKMLLETRAKKNMTKIIIMMILNDIEILIVKHDYSLI